MNIAFRCDAGWGIGNGQILRSLALANALKARGGTCLFLCHDAPDFIAGQIIAAGHRIETLLSQNPMVNLDRDSLEQEDAAACLKALPGGVDWLVVAHVALGSVWESAMRPAARRILAVDTLARQHDCDIVFDQTHGRDRAAYEPFAPKNCEIFCGARDAWMLPEFAAARELSLPRRRDPHPLRRVLISFGHGEFSGVLTAAIYCLDKLPGIEVRAIRGGSRHLPDLDLVDYPIQLLDRVDNMAEHLAWADLAIGAGNSMVWERACLGVPSINVPLNGHQDLNASNATLAG
ncbi:MAG: UDP-2,4-diacetamido-2,4, 6-trideoxy-beta-L-altropyranose hydrolase [Verrucomicrobiota bacterium]|jgi:UDP-2,4-diacetamido-2,4,6-trideoxy-beta-L-altropyranose hydrolase